MGSSTLDINLAASLLSLVSSALHREPQIQNWSTYVMEVQLCALFVLFCHHNPQIHLLTTVDECEQSCQSFCRVTFFGLVFFFNLSKIPLHNPNLHIKIIGYYAAATNSQYYIIWNQYGCMAKKAVVTMNHRRLIFLGLFLTWNPIL